MMRGRSFALFLVLSLMANAFCLPPHEVSRRRRGLNDNKVDDISEKLSKERSISDDVKTTNDDDDDDDDDFDFKPTSSSSSSGGSNLFSLLNIVTALLPTMSNNNNVKKNNEFIKKTIREVIQRYQTRTIQKRQDIGDNVIEIDYATELKPPFFQRQESEENDSESSESESEEDNGAEESVEEPSNENNGSKSKQDSEPDASNGNGDNGNGDDSNGSDDSDYDEPEGDGQGGGILGLLAGLSGEGESDLGSLLAAVGGIVANLSGDGVDINALIATGLGLFVGLLSDEGSNPGEIIASYLLTSLDTITGGGAKNNGAFFGRFITTLLKGTSAAEDPESGSDENGNGGMKMADSAGFFASLLMGLLGEMSKNSSGSGWR